MPTAETPARNPFRPGVGLVPAHLAGRDRQMRRFAAVLSSAPEIPGNLRLTGLRGVGKTVLLRKFNDIAQEAGWATVLLELEPRHNDDTQLVSLLSARLGELRRQLSTRERLREAVAGTVEAIRQVATVSVEDVELSLSGQIDTGAAELATELSSAAQTAVKAGRRGLTLLFDEAQVLSDERDRDGTHPLSMLLAAVSYLQRREIPVCLVLCGLPNLTINLLDARTYSERMFRGDELDTLDPQQARQAFLVPLEDTGKSASTELVDQVLRTVDGYPYFIQLWGAELWDAATYARSTELTTELLHAIESEIYQRLDLDFYAPRVDSLTPAEQDLLLDAADCDYPPLLAGQLAQRSPKTSGNVNVLLGRLVKANVLYRQGKGRYFYTAPGFDEYLRRRAQRLAP